MTSRLPNWAVGIGSSIMGVMFAGNIWFGSRMISQFDKMQESFWLMSQKVVVLEARLDSVCKQGGKREK